MTRLAVIDQTSGAKATPSTLKTDMIVVLLLFSFLACLAPEALAQGAGDTANSARGIANPSNSSQEAIPDTQEIPVKFSRGEGGQLSILKLGLLLLIFFPWIYTANWINQDCDFANMSHVVWNMIFVFPFLLAMILALVIPFFIAGFFLPLLSYLIPTFVYVVQRNARVGKADQVLTVAHIVAVLSGKPARKAALADKEKGPPIGLISMGADSDLDNKANLLGARQSPGFLSARELLYDALDRRSEKIMLDYSQESVSVRYEIDGVWHDAGGHERDSSDLMLAVLKQIANLNIEDRRSRQVGQFGTTCKRKKQTWNFLSQGTKTGERAVFQLDLGKTPTLTLDELGLRPKLEELLRELLNYPSGIILFSSLPGGGLTNTLNAALRSADRYTRHFVTYEDETRLEPEVDNVEVNRFDFSKDKSSLEKLTRLVRTEPDVILAPHLSDASAIELLCHHANDNKLVICTIRAKEAAEALLRVLMLKVSVEEFSPVIKAVINQRLIRKLCDECKESYNPPPDLIAKLGLPAERVYTFYREPQERSDDEEVCSKCGGIGYRGRTSVFEILKVGEKIREALVKQPKLEVLRKASKQEGNRSLQEEGIIMVARGTTSLQELMRILKQ